MSLDTRIQCVCAKSQYKPDAPRLTRSVEPEESRRRQRPGAERGYPATRGRSAQGLLPGSDGIS